MGLGYLHFRPTGIDFLYYAGQIQGRCQKKQERATQTIIIIKGHSPDRCRIKVNIEGYYPQYLLILQP